jgi:hypothetical protein
MDVTSDWPISLGGGSWELQMIAVALAIVVLVIGIGLAISGRIKRPRRTDDSWSP